MEEEIIWIKFRCWYIKIIVETSRGVLQINEMEYELFIQNRKFPLMIGHSVFVNVSFLTIYSSKVSSSFVAEVRITPSQIFSSHMTYIFSVTYLSSLLNWKFAIDFQIIWTVESIPLLTENWIRFGSPNRFQSANRLTFFGFWFRRYSLH